MPPGMFASLLLVLSDPNLIPPAFLYIVTGLFGAIIGSFLNVVIHRLPRREGSIKWPFSWRLVYFGAV